VLSVVIPVYNERATVQELLEQVKAVEIAKEIVVVDDCSTDGTREILQTLEDDQVRIVYHDRNRGKGAALRTGFGQVRGEVVVIQDADLEYDPQDWHEMYRLIAEDRADIVYGSRFYGKSHRALYWHHYMGNRTISWLINVLCDITLSDIEVCYKMFRREVLDSLTLTNDSFGFEVEFTVKVAKAKRWRIYETGIHYYGRTYDEGKKITWRDGVKALWFIFRYRFFA
jgi:glycosyltransferase involved in cell wall biosynthesis